MSYSPPAPAPGTAKAAAPVVGLLYDDRMCAHATPDNESHPENPERLRSIWRKLSIEGIPQRCVVLKAKEAEVKYIAAVHSQDHVKLIRNISSSNFDHRRNKIAQRFNSIYFNKGSSESAFLAAGSVIDVADKVAKGALNSAIALVRPPGHHAEHGEAMGFCLFNNVAIAARFLLNSDLGIKKILIVDWDVHHGNGTQNMFYKDPRVLFFSVHRFDQGTFYPAGFEGAHFMVGEGDGQGYNINVPWQHGACGDADYVAVWDHVLLPVAKSFNPDIILISAGFDAALGDPLGGCRITPSGYAKLLDKLVGYAQGKIVMILEGGYNLKSIADSVFACAKVLLGDEPTFPSKHDKPFESTWRVIKQVRYELKPFWDVLADELPDTMVSEAKPCPVWLNDGTLEEDDGDEDVEVLSGSNASIEDFSSVDSFAQTGSKLESAFAKLTIEDQSRASSLNSMSTTQSQIGKVELPGDVNSAVCKNMLDSNAPWRSELSKTYVWYACYGSNMWKPRFLCYIEGGKAEGMGTACCGSMDRSPPKDVKWKVVGHRLFFGRSFTSCWGAGGTAFLDPTSTAGEKSYICLYKISFEQFNDVLFQENKYVAENTLTLLDSPLINISDLSSLPMCSTLHIDAIKNGWYSNVLYLGEEDNVPIVTMTCSAADVERFKRGEVPLCAPSESYFKTLQKGLVEGMQLSTEAAAEYLRTAASRSL